MSNAHIDNEHRPAAAPMATAADLIQCGGCGKQSDPAVRFCGGCGARLWEPCASCEAVNPVDQKFCGGCGISLADALAEASRGAAELLKQAEAQSEQGEYAAAVATLEKIDLPSHTGLEALSRSATQRIEDIHRLREEVASTAGERFIEANELAAKGAIRDALAVAKKIPPALRGLELRNLHDELEAKIAETDRLKRHIKEGLAKKDYTSVHSAVTQLLQIEPTNEKMVALESKLSSQQAKIDRGLGRKQLKSARSAIKKCDYRAAEAALSLVPPADYDEKTSNALQIAREQVWLAHQLARAPYVDQTLVAIADRLAKLQPHDEKVGKLRLELSKRWKEGLRKQPGRAIPWGKAPASEDDVVIAAMTFKDAFAKPLVAKGYSPGQFMTAYGLALQAAGAARIKIDLMPKRRGWASRLSLGKKKPRGESIAWGVDIGTHSIKAVRLAVAGDGEPVFEDFYIDATLPEGTEAAGGGGSTPPGAAAAVQRLLQKHDLTDANVAIGISGTLTLGRFFDLPWLSEAKFSEAVRYEARTRIPLDPEDVYTDYHGQDLQDEDLAGDADGAKLMRVVLVAGNRAHVDEHAQLFADSGAASLIVSTDGVALANAFASQIDEKILSVGPAAVVDLGSKTTNTIVLSETGCWFRGAYAGAVAFDEELVKQLKCNWRKAEETRSKMSKAKWMHEIDEALAPAFAATAELIERTIAQHCSEGGRPVGRIFLTGGGAEQYGLLRDLR